MAERSTGDLVRAAADGDAVAWAEIVDAHSRLVWAVVRSHRLRDADAGDVYQTTWLRLVENLGRLEHPELVSSWLVTTARRECLRVTRARDRELPHADLTDHGGLDFFAHSPGPEAALLASEERAAVATAFGALQARCQAILRLTLADPPPSYAQIAEMLDIPIGSIGPTRRRCLDHLRSLYAAGDSSHT